MNLILTSIAASGLLAAIAMAQPPHYTITDLGVIGGPPGQVSWLANTSLGAGAATVPAGSMHAVLWYKNLKIDIGKPGLGGPNSAAFGNNVFGQAVGIAETSVANSEDFCGFNAYGFPSLTACVPFVWQNGVMTKLPTLGGANGYANNINDWGEVVGEAETTMADPNPACPVSQFKPVIWKNGAIQVLPTYAGDPDGEASRNNDLGQVVGSSGTCAAPLNLPAGTYLVTNHALLWEKGTVTDLGDLGPNGFAGNHACAINNLGQVVGRTNSNVSTVAFLWTRKAGMLNLGTLPGDFASIALAINDSGVVVGLSIDSMFNLRAFVWEKGAMTDLNTVVSAPSGWTLRQAESINAKGEIVGWASTSTGEVHGFLATPK